MKTSLSGLALAAALPLLIGAAPPPASPTPPAEETEVSALNVQGGRQITGVVRVVPPDGGVNVIMGCTGVCEEDELPRHTVNFKHTFVISRSEVTFAEWDLCVSQGGCNAYVPRDPWGRGNRPVVNVSYNDALAYIAWLSKDTGRNWRLPTEAEWEFAMRAGTDTPYWTGTSIGHNQARYGFIGTMPAGFYPDSPFGHYDLAGNAWEWVQDCYTVNYVGAPTDGAQTASRCAACPPPNQAPVGPRISGSTERGKPEGPAGSDGSLTPEQARDPKTCRHVIRGGSWFRDQPDLRNSSRHWSRSDNRSGDIGFRVARTLSEEEKYDITGRP